MPTPPSDLDSDVSAPDTADRTSDARSPAAAARPVGPRLLRYVPSFALAVGAAAWYTVGPSLLPVAYQEGIARLDLQLLGTVPLLLAALVALALCMLDRDLSNRPDDVTVLADADADAEGSEPMPSLVTLQATVDLVASLRQAALDQATQAAAEAARADATQATLAQVRAELAQARAELDQTHADANRRLDDLDAAHNRVVASLTAQVQAATERARKAEAAQGDVEHRLSEVEALRSRDVAAAAVQAQRDERALFDITLAAITESTLVDLPEDPADAVRSHAARIQLALTRLTAPADLIAPPLSPNVSAGADDAPGVSATSVNADEESPPQRRFRPGRR